MLQGQNQLFEKHSFKDRLQPWPLISALALILFAWAGFSAVWGGATIASVRFKAPNDAEDISAYRSIQIHSLVPGRQKASRVGKLYPLGNNEVAIYLYPDIFDRDINAVKFVMVDASVRLLWQLTPKPVRLKAERSLQKFIEETHADLEKIITSDEFQSKYQSQFYEIVNDAARRAFDEPETKEALDEAYNELLVTFGREFVTEYLDLLTKKSTLVLDTLIDSFAKNLFNLENGGELDFDPIRRAIEQMLLDPVIKVAVQRRMEKFLSSDAAANLSITFGRRFIANTYRDPRLYDLLNALLADIAYSSDLKKFELMATESIRVAVLEVLTRGNDSMNSVGAAILKNAFIGDQNKIVLMLTDEQLESLSRENPQTFTPFVRL